MEKIVERNIVQRLNGLSTMDELRERGRILLPAPSGETLTFDLTKPYRPREVLIEEYWRFHPRYLFLKSVPERGRLADLGAGSGGLIGWKAWGEPVRNDMFMYAVDLSEGELFDQYVDFEIADLGRSDTKYPDGVFDAVILSHVIEHVADRRHLAAEVARITHSGAKVYVEWPTVESGANISRSELAAFGLDCSTLNFFDDATHLELIGERDAEATFAAAGFKTLVSGTIFNDFLCPELLRCGILENDIEATTYALWLAFGFSRYLIFEKT